MARNRDRSGLAIGAVISVWLLVLLANLGFWGVVVWAIIKLVNAHS